MWKNLSLAALAFTSIYLLYQFTSASDHVSAMSTRLMDSVSSSHMIWGDAPLIEEGIDGRLVWTKGSVPPTRILRQAAGWNVLDNLYTLNGTMYIVTDEPETFPERRMMVGSGYIVLNGADEVAKREPTDKDMRIVSTNEARQLFGTFANRLDGVTFLNNDPQQFIRHYYHFAAELFFGWWRTYSSLDTRITEDGITSLPPPRRMLFTRVDNYRDYASMNQYLMNGIFPSISIEHSRDWQDRNETHQPYVFDRVVLADRSAAMRGPEFTATERTASEAFSLVSSRPWWSPVRANLVEFIGLNRSIGAGTRDRPVITYVSRQDWGRRMLIPEDHDKLVAALHELEESYGYEVNIVSMDKLSKEEQLRLSARTTVMLGVHGNGLTNLLWMNPTPRSTVIEFFYPHGFAFDYEWTTRALNMIHYGFWGSEVFTSPKLPPVAYPQGVNGDGGFQGNNIPLDGKKVADLIHWRLSLAEEGDD